MVRLVIAFCLALFLVSPKAVSAEEKSESRNSDRVYVSVARSNLRSGPGAQYSALAVVSAGQELEVLASQDEWLKVDVVAGGRAGWIIRKAVTNTPPTPVVVKSLERKLASIQQQNEELSAEIRRLSDARQDLELKASQQRTEVSLLTARNQELQSWRTILWFILGLIILLTGWVLGYVAGMFRKQADDKRYDTLIRDAANKKA